MTTVDTEPLLNLSEIAEIELFILKRMKEFTLGDHSSVFKGAGFNFVGIREWQPGDRTSSIDWAQSSLTNFSPIITREFEQDSNATIVAVADASLSTRCGVHGALIASAIARSVAAVGLSAVFFQDLFGLITFDEGFRQMAAARPRIGKSHVNGPTIGVERAQTSSTRRRAGHGDCDPVPPHRVPAGSRRLSPSR